MRKEFMYLGLLLMAFGLSTSPSANVINFDGLAPGTAVTTIDGISFTDSIGLGLIVSNTFDTTSGDNYLGVDDGGSEVFLPGDVVTLTFAAGITSLSVNFVSSPFTPAVAFEIQTSEGSSTSAASPDAFLPDFGEVFSVTFNSATPFLSADLVSFVLPDPLSPDEDAIYSYNIDDIEFDGGSENIPEPSSYFLIGLGVLLLLGFTSSQRKMTMSFQPNPS